MPKITIIFQPDGKRVQINSGSTVLSAAQISGIDIVSICGGKGTCGKCKVIINTPHAVESITPKEIESLTKKEIQNGYRLACCTIINENCTIKIPESSRTGKQRLQAEGIETKIALEPSIKKYYIEIEPPTLIDPHSDLDRLLKTLENTHNLTNLAINYNLLKNLPEKVRIADWKCTVIVWDKMIIEIEPEDTTNQLYGYAVDIGTTKLAGYLLDLSTGIVLAADSLMNPQIPYGEDVIARLNFTPQETLQKTVVEALNSILKELLEKTGIKKEHIYEMTVVGNTVMHHIFLGINPLYLGRAPYPPAVRHPITIDSRNLGIDIDPNGKVFVLPTIAGFVGADTIGVMLSSEIYKKEKIHVAIDIGTNTEIVLGNKEKLMTVSCASGPAFEGAHIKFGMRARSGAIEKISIEPGTLNVKCQTIDNEPPIGICGSGMIDLVAEMLKTGVIDIGGVFTNIEHARITEKDGFKQFIVIPSNESGIQEDITFSFKDVNQIILAKAAIHTGFKILLKKFGIDKDQIEKLFIAGAFGSHINKESARMIGLFPEIDLDRIEVIGNAAGTGARMCLVSKNAKKKTLNLSKLAEYVELGVDPDFQNIFLNSNIIPYADLDEFPEMSKFLKKTGNYPEIPPPKFG
ncbi:MAG: DUF4445 domain-containing protein [Promethearchaeota archaeon]|nr:MAG: DUF4445 domain-containing protein [Candidatus Lokiarchaeota archaeon]